MCYRAVMRMTNATMYARVFASDASCNGRFFFGVTSTGIYCLPSCHAKKPKPENTRFFPTVEAARAAGLRACKKCHPDDFARGADPVLETIESLVAEVRAAPQNFPDARAIVRRSGFGATRAFELFRQHYHTTPADLLLRARLDAAKALLVGRALRPTESVGDKPWSPSAPPEAGKPRPTDSLAAISAEVGFESLSVFHDHFRRLNGLTPAAYRELRSAHGFEVALPEGYLLGYLRRALSRDIHSLTERLSGDVYTTVAQFSTGPALMTLRLSPTSVRAEISGGPALEAHALVVGLLGLDEEAAAFARLARRLGLARLVTGRPELRISQTPSVFDGLLWSIIGQQINFPFACLLKRRLIERTSQPFAEGLYAPPTPAAVAALEPGDLLPLQFSRQKADYVIQTARLVAEGKLDLAALHSMSATRAERTLLAVRGLGPWSVNYLMMRSLGFPDCVPLGDTGVTSGLQALLKLEVRPDLDATRRLMAVFSPYRSLATAHLWQFNQPIP
ncbi:MAG: DNA-3-methyladenine glycosylase 2 family protein [Verrucomicrobia bacterium]|nr:DNA-3-methyladenine glycosylase 2 family protein [Verrucomicrobiota bacterium]